MAKGDRTFTSAGRQVRKFESTPPMAGDYRAKLRLNDWKVKVAAGAGKLPYVSGPIELLDTAATEGGKNRIIFTNLFLDTTPSEKDQISMVERQNGIIALARAIGAELENIPLQTKTKLTDKGEVTVEILNPQSVMQWLKQNFDGVVFSLHTKVEKGTQGYPDRGVVDYYIEAEEGSATSTESDEEYELEGAETNEETDDEEVLDDDATNEDEDIEAADVTEDEEVYEEEPVRKAKPVQRSATTKPMKNGTMRKTAVLAKTTTKGRAQARR